MNRGLRPRLGRAAYLALAGRGRTVVVRREREVIFSQGDAADSLMYVLDGLVTLSVCESRDMVVGILGPDACFGDECLTGRVHRKWTATTITPSTVFVVGKAEMMKLLRTKPVLARRFLTDLLARRIQNEDDLIAQLQSSCEQRLARTLLLLAGFGPHRTRTHTVPRMSQAALAAIVGDTRSRINYFLQKFEARGFIKRAGALTVRRSLRRVLLPVRRRPSTARPSSSRSRSRPR